ncbi:MAG: hypothetical protein HY757_01580 [Nitrospirae bacterium]|nr:hypothetical protein [Nitrospirota bacterium]
MNNNNLIPKLLWLTLFAIAMAYVESAVVVYLRAIFHPEGFAFPLKAFNDYKIKVEVFREAATMIMLLTVAHLAGKKFWERFAYFMLSFGVWDIFYYVWLKVLLDWPASLFDWDVLFLIPLPWIGPVIAPLSIAILMIIFSILMARKFHKGSDFRPAPISYVLALAGMIIVLYSFMYDIAATLHGQMPKPYRYELLIIGDVLFVAAFWIAYIKCRDKARLAPVPN